MTVKNFRVLFFTQGDYGEKIFSNFKSCAPISWSINRIQLPQNLPNIIDNPEPIIKKILPQRKLECDLLVFLGESPQAFELLTDFRFL